MAVSVKQLLVSILFVGFAVSALLNHDRAYMLEFVKLVTFGMLVAMAYGIWASAGEDRAFCAGFLIWGGLYYMLFVVIRTDRLDLGTETLLARLARHLALTSPRFSWALYERTGHLLASLVCGVIGSWVTVYFYRKRQRMLARRAPTGTDHGIQH